MGNSILEKMRSGWMLLRVIAVISSSFVAILSSLLPLFLYTTISNGYLVMMFLFLSIGALTIHGGLTHLFNDYADHLSGTDEHSPALLSGGSRVIQEGKLAPAFVLKLGIVVTVVLLIFAFVMGVVGNVEITVLIVVGVWAAISYSLPPLSLSYRPIVGEWLSLFPAMFFLGIAGPWILLDSIPLWAYQHAIINAFICMGWVMIHHIPDIGADRQASPKKNTTVVWVVEKIGMKFAFVPAFLYFSIALGFAMWVAMERILAGVIVAALLVIALLFIVRINSSNVEQVTTIEKTLLLLAILIGITLGTIM